MTATPDQDEPDDLDTAEPTDDEILGAVENLDADPPPADEPPAKEVKNGSEKVSAAKLVDEAIRTLVSPLAKALLNIAKANGGKGTEYQAATDHLNNVIGCLKEMKGGKR